MDAEADLDVIVEPPFTHVPPFRSEPEIAMVRDALRLLAGASRPVIVAGGGVTVRATAFLTPLRRPQTYQNILDRFLPDATWFAW